MMDLTVSGLEKSFGQKKVLSSFSAVFAAGEITCIMGASGCGKTTLLNLLLGFLKPDAGEIAGVPEKISAVFQEDRLCEDYGAVANVKIAAGKNRTIGEITECLCRLGLSDSLKKPVRELSGGMKRRVAIARALMADAELFVFDEPFKGLDEGTRGDVAAFMRKKLEGKTVLLITHDEEDAKRLNAKIIRMDSVAE